MRRLPKITLHRARFRGSGLVWLTAGPLYVGFMADRKGWGLTVEWR